VYEAEFLLVKKKSSQMQVLWGFQQLLDFTPGAVGSILKFLIAKAGYGRFTAIQM
jgi:hypothetical protein